MTQIRVRRAKDIFQFGEHNDSDFKNKKSEAATNFGKPEYNDSDQAATFKRFPFTFPDNFVLNIFDT